MDAHSNPYDANLCQAEELIDFVIRNRLFTVACATENPERCPFYLAGGKPRWVLVWSANAREQIAEYLKRIKSHAVSGAVR